MKFIVYHKNGNTKIIDADTFNDAEKKANDIWRNWEDIKILDYVKPRKSVTLDKRQYVKKSDKIYNRNKSKRKLKKEISNG